MKWFLTAFSALIPWTAWPQIGSGTVIFVYFSQNEVTVAADSRTISSSGAQNDNECKISTFGRKFAFTMAGIAQRDRGSNSTVWNAHSVARRAWEKESPKHVDDAPGLTLATERTWTEDMKSIYADPAVIRFLRQRMKPGDDPILATAVFIATDNLGRLIVHGISIGFDVGLYDSQGKIAVSETRRYDLPENSHVTGGHDEIINEFLGKTSTRARDYMSWFNASITGLSSGKQNANLASKMIELSILLHPKNQELGLPIDLIQMNRTVGLRVLSMKPECYKEEHRK